MATYEKTFLSCSPNVNFPQGFTDISLLPVHQADYGPTKDEIWLWVSNTSTSLNRISLSFGTAEDPVTFATFDIPALSTVLVCPGIPFSSDGGSYTNYSLYISDLSFASNYIYFFGYVNRITP